MCAILILGVAGLAVDITQGLRVRTQLQATADAAALAAAIDLPDENRVIASAVAYSRANMARGEHGTVLRDSDVETGRWHPQYHLFDATSPTPDAVRVRVRRATENENPVPALLLRIVGWNKWDVTVHAIAQRFIPDCLTDGLVAEGQVVMSSNNRFSSGFCIHGQHGVRARQGNTFDRGARVTMPPGVDVTAPGGDVSGNPGLADALGQQILHPWMVNHVPAIIAGLLARDTALLPDYIDAELPVLIRDRNWDFADAAAGRIYHIECASPDRLSTVPAKTVLDRVAVVSDCNLNVHAGARLSDVLLASRGGGVPAPGESAAPGTGVGTGAKPEKKVGESRAAQKANILVSSNVHLGAADDCATGGGVQVFSTGNVQFSAGIVINGLQIVTAGDFDLGANNISVTGINAQAGGDIKLESMSDFTACGDGVPGLFTVDYYRLVY